MLYRTTLQRLVEDFERIEPLLSPTPASESRG